MLLETLWFGNEAITLCLPDASNEIAAYRQAQATGTRAEAPYWSQVWPSAKALTLFLQANAALIQHKKVLEIAGGLGLPSLYAARHAREVLCTDAEEKAMQCVAESIGAMQIQNMRTSVLNWHTTALLPPADVLLLSDINYNPDDFECISRMIHHYLYKGTLILLATPQRLMAKPLITALLPYAIRHETLQIMQHTHTIDIAVYVLKVS